MMLIRQYQKGDEELIDGNGLTEGREVAPLGADFAETYTLTEQDKPIIIICFLEYFKRCYNGMILCDKQVDARHMAVLRAFLNRMAENYLPIRLETCSINTEENNKFHRFLGFEHEGVKRKYIGDKDYNVWGRLWE